MATANTIKQLNEPVPVEVEAAEDGSPRRICLRTVETETGPRKARSPRLRQQRQEYRAIRSDGLWMTVSSIDDYWKINDEWWRGEELEIERLYFDVVLESNQRLTIFHDLISDGWFRQAD